MYTLHYSPGSCSLIIHIFLEEIGIPFESKRVDLEGGEHRREPYLSLNPKGKVPALATPDGVLTECLAILEHLADKHGEERWLGKPGTWHRAKILEQLATLGTEVHPWFARYFHPDDYSPEAAVQEAVKKHAAVKLVDWFAREDPRLVKPYWSGEAPTLADLYFLVIARWGRWLNPPANRMPNIEAFTRRMGERPAVQRALEREGIVLFGA